MQVSYTMDIDEINGSFIRSLKRQFKRAKVQVNIMPMDETDYLTSTEANTKALNESINQFAEGKVVTFDSSTFFSEMQKKLKDA